MLDLLSYINQYGGFWAVSNGMGDTSSWLLGGKIIANRTILPHQCLPLGILNFDGKSAEPKEIQDNPAKYS